MCSVQQGKACSIGTWPVEHEAQIGPFSASQGSIHVAAYSDHTPQCGVHSSLCNLHGAYLKYTEYVAQLFITVVD